MQDKELFETVGLHIRVERTKKRITQAGLADIIDVHEKYIGKIETGTLNITLKTLNRIANALNIDVYTLLIKN